MRKDKVTKDADGNTVIIRTHPPHSRRKGDCDPVSCGMEGKLDKALEKFVVILDKLSDNQVEMRITIQRLSDNGDFVQKLDNKLDRVEAKVDKNSNLTWKLVGIGTGLATLIPYVLRELFK